MTWSPFLPTRPPQRSVPTVREYREQIESTFSKGTRRTYRSYWLLAERIYGDKRLDAVTSDDIEKVVVAAAERARAKRPGTDARSPRENCVAAQRAFFERARRAKLILENHAAEVTKPRRHPSTRRGLDEQELAETIEAVRSTSRDLELDLLLVEFHLVSGARQEGALRWLSTTSATAAPRRGCWRSSTSCASNRSLRR